MAEWWQRTGVQLADGLARGEIDAEQMAESVLTRIADREPALNALWLHEPERVRAEAADSRVRREEGRARSRWDGVPVTIKENVARAGWPMPAGTALPDPLRAAANAPITDRLEEAGCVIVGATTMPDWGMLSSGISSRHGISRNAWDQSLTTGGSSAGAGAAAAGGYGPWHVGTDIGGSIRLPATWQGLASLKPSEGLIPLDVPYLGRAAGPMCRRVEDVAAMMSVLGVPDARDYSTRGYPAMDWALRVDVSGLRVGVHTEAGYGLPVDPRIAAAVENAAELLRSAGARVERVEPFVTEELLSGIDGFWRARSLADLRDRSEAEQELVLPYIRQWCAGGERFDGAQTVRNYQQCAALARVTRAATAAYDVVLSPVAPVLAFPAEKPMPQDDPELPMQHISFTLPYNMSGQPAGTINADRADDGRWIGLQVSAGIGRDDLVVGLLRWFEERLPTPDWASVP
ncbi:amidase [Naumannella sp. ID2617S]|nr:amidase [Naumannella sp. ID2617S]